MAIPAVPRERLLDAMNQFDHEVRDSAEFRDWTENGAYRYAIEENGKLYPVKKIVSIATGVPVKAFYGGDEANSYVQARGFTVAPLPGAPANGIQAGLEAVVARYRDARQGQFGGTHEVVRLLEKLERQLQVCEPVTERPTLRVKASAGMGNWARVPWIAFLDSRETTSTQDGVYVVFLFREDMSGVYLTLNQGVTVPKQELGVTGARAQLRDRATQLRKYCAALVESGFRIDGEIDLRAEEGLGADYENSTVAYKLYERDHVPPDDLLTNDLSKVLEAYDEYLDDKGVRATGGPGYWVFQANPTRYDLATALGQRKEMAWLALQRARTMRVGDRVFMWEAGPNAGIVGYATIIKAPENSPFPDDEIPFSRDPEKFEGLQPRVRLRIEGTVSPRVTKAELEAHLQLRELAIVRAPRMTNYLLTPDQGRTLEALVADRARTVSQPISRPEPTVPPRLDLAAVSQAFAQALATSHVSFGANHERVVRSFIASLATKRFVILTGLSGSGKTQIGVRFGDWLGPGRSLIVAVRPDWTGSEALFGYEDALQPAAADGRRSWHAPEVLRFMLQAAQDPHWPYLLVLDEMNLAHVERYFADVLSGMETGHDCLSNLTLEGGYWRVRPQGPEKIPVPGNLFIVGTVNIDETTYLFSPKVLDRANTFEFRVDTADLVASAQRPQPCSPGDAALVRGFLAIAGNDNWHLAHQAAGAVAFESHLRTVHGLLSEAGLEFGHRVFYEAIRFSAMLESAGSPDPLEALDLQVMQKVLPRMHGSRRRLEAPLCAVAKFCLDLSFEPGSAEPGRPAKFDPLAAPPHLPQLAVSFDKVRRMVRSLRANQFTSFTE